MLCFDLLFSGLAVFAAVFLLLLETDGLVCFIQGFDITKTVMDGLGIVSTTTLHLVQLFHLFNLAVLVVAANINNDIIGIDGRGSSWRLLPQKHSATATIRLCLIPTAFLPVAPMIQLTDTFLFLSRTVLFVAFAASFVGLLCKGLLLLGLEVAFNDGVGRILAVGCSFAVGEVQWVEGGAVEARDRVVEAVVAGR